MRLVQRNSFHALHGEKQSGQANPLAFRIQYLANEIVKGIQINGADRNARRIHGNQRSP